MTAYSPSGTAALMLTAATRYDTDGAQTLRRAQELALPATHTADVHVASSGTSDPTPDQAMNEVPAIATYLPRWRACTTALQGWVGTPLSEALRAAEPKVRNKAPGPWSNPYLINRIGHQCDELIRLIDLCKPVNLDEARRTLGEAKKLEHASNYCRACETPGRTKSGLCHPSGCYELQRWHVNQGNTDMADLSTFSAYVMERVLVGKLKRKASPHYMRDAPRHMPEDQRIDGDYQCAHCGRTQHVTGKANAVVGCQDCGHRIDVA